MDKFDFYKELYFKENDRRMEVQNSMNIPIAVITATASVVFYLITTMSFENGAFVNWVFYILVIVSNIGLLVSIYYLIRAFGAFFKGYEYSAIPYVQQLYDWNKDIEKHFTDQGNPEEDAKAHFDNYIIENLIKHTDHNMYVNDQKFSFIFRAKKFLVFSMICTLLSIVPYFYSQFSSPTEISTPERIEIIKVPESINSELKKNTNSIKSQTYDCKTSKSDTATTATGGQTDKRRN